MREECDDLIITAAANRVGEDFDFGGAADFIERISLPRLTLGLGAQSDGMRAFDVAIPGARGAWSRSSRGAVRLFDEEHDPARRLLGDRDLIAGFADEIGNVENRERIRAMDLQLIARHERLQRLARLQNRQRAIQPHQIEFLRSHAGQNDGADAYRQLARRQ